MIQRLFVALFAISVLGSCSVAPEEIQYGEDQCSYCRMGIVDKQHAAQYVTSKGKQFKFDAIECMARKLGDPEIKESDLTYVLVADYENSGVMVNASDVTFLISKKIKSPMGAYLSGFSNADNAKAKQEELGGTIYDWGGIKNKFK